MELTNNEKRDNSDKAKKIVKISLIISIMLFFIVLAIMFYYSYKDSKELKFYVDRNKTELASDLLIFDTNTNKIYVSISDIAKIAGYEYYNGDYSKLTEEQTKCYLNNKKEVAGFELGSNQLYKIDPTDNTANYEWYTIDEPVRTVNGKLYATSTAIQTACNISFAYNKEKNRIEVLTLPYLVTSYESIVTTQYGYSGLDSEYKNQKAILHNMLVVKKQESKDKYKYGVVSLDNKQIIGTKYDAIEYIEVANDFYVTTDKKVGIMSSEGAQKIEPNYDSIKVLDNELRLYCVKNSNLYGVLDKNGKRVLYLEYSKIGIDASLFPNNDIKNNMLLFDNCIPVEKNGKWGIFDKNGNVLAETAFDSLGFVNGTKKDTVSNNLLTIPSIEAIVLCKDGKYGLMNSSGKYLAPCAFDKIYSVTNLGENKYYLEYNGTTYELDDYLKLNSENTNTGENTNDETNTMDANTVFVDPNSSNIATVEELKNVVENSNITTVQ